MMKLKGGEHHGRKSNAIARRCANCKKSVPNECDGKLYRLSDLEGVGCLGANAPNFVTGPDGELRYRFGEDWEEHLILVSPPLLIGEYPHP